MNRDVKLTKVLFSKNMDQQEEQYLDYLSADLNVVWDETVFNFPISVGDYAVHVENQIVSRISVSDLSTTYKENLQYLLEVVFSEEISSIGVSKIIKKLEKED